MSDFTSPSAIKAGVDALEQGYERFLAITRERLETVYPAAAMGFDQLDEMRRRTIDNVLSAGKTAAHGWDDVSAMVAANQEAMMESVRALSQSWFGGGARDAIDAIDSIQATLGEMRARMTADIEAMRTHAAELGEQQGEALKTATDGLTAEIEAAKQSIQGAASEAVEAKSEAVEAKSEAAEAKSEAASASEAVSALSASVEEKIGAQIDVLRGALDADIAANVESQIDTARKEIERETDEEVDEKLGALKSTVEERLSKIEAALAADIAKMRDEIAGLAKAAKAKKPAAAKRTTAKATKKAGA